MTDKLIPRLQDKRTGQFKKGNLGMTLTAGHSHFIATGDVPAGVRGRRRINRYLSGLSRGLVEECGGAEKMGIRRELMVRQVIRSEGILTLIEAYLMKRGITKPGNMELVPMMQSSYLSYLRAQQTAIMNLTTLLSEKDQGDDVPHPLEIARLIDIEKAGAAARAAGGPRLAQDGRSTADVDDGKDREASDPGGNGQGDGKQALEIDGAGRSQDGEARDVDTDQGGA